MLLPIYCREDSNGPLTKEEALRLLNLMRDRACNRAAEHQVLKKGRTRQEDDIFQYSCGEQTALDWAIDVLGRTVFDPKSSHKAMLDTAEYLEREAQHLRRRVQEELS